MNIPLLQEHTMIVIVNNTIIFERMKDRPKQALIKKESKVHPTIIMPIIKHRQIEEHINQEKSYKSIEEKLIEDRVVKISKCN